MPSPRASEARARSSAAAVSDVISSSSTGAEASARYDNRSGMCASPDGRAILEDASGQILFVETLVCTVRQSYLRADFAAHHLQRLQRRQADKIFNAFFATKPNGIGIGTSHQPYHR